MFLLPAGISQSLGCTLLLLLMLSSSDARPPPIPGEYGPELDQGAQHFRGLCWEQERTVSALIDAIDTGDRERAKEAYVASRIQYEQIETLAPSFPDEDRKIDARPYAFDGGELNPEFQGFHKVERALYRDDDMAVAANYSRGLFRTVFGLCRKLQDPSIYSVEKTWEGLLALAVEVCAKKISSEEETWSDLSLLIFRENWKGIFSQYAPFAKRLSVPRRRAVWRAYLDLRDFYVTVLDKDNGWDGLTFRPYSAVPIPERRGVIVKGYVFAEALIAAHKELFG